MALMMTTCGDVLCVSKNVRAFLPVAQTVIAKARPLRSNASEERHILNSSIVREPPRDVHPPLRSQHAAVLVELA